MFMDKLWLYSDSIRLFASFIKNASLTPSSVISYESINADYYLPTKEKKNPPRILIIFHGLNHLGNKDQRILNLVRGFLSIGFACLVPNVPPAVEFRTANEKDITLMERFLNHFIEQQSDKSLFYLFGASTSCVYVGKLAFRSLIKDKITSIGLLSPYFSMKCFKEILENTPCTYTRIGAIKLILYSNPHLYSNPENYRHELHIFDTALKMAFKDQKNPELRNKVIQFIASGATPKSPLHTLFPLLVDKAPFPAELLPLLKDIEDLGEYADLIQHSNAKFTIIHSDQDEIFHPSESLSLKTHLDKFKIKNKVLVTKLLDHAELKFNRIFEVIKLLGSVQHFLSHSIE